MPRELAIQTIGEELTAIRDRITRLGYGVVMPKTAEGLESKLFIRADDAEVKVEVNYVFRGTVRPIDRRQLVPAARERFAASIELPVLAPAELYGSKLVAALDRQHPRDLFDVKLMLETGHRWDEETMDCFVVYLAGHNRPMHEHVRTTSRVSFVTVVAAMCPVGGFVSERSRARATLVPEGRGGQMIGAARR